MRRYGITPDSRAGVAFEYGWRDRIANREAEVTFTSIVDAVCYVRGREEAARCPLPMLEFERFLRGVYRQVPLPFPSEKRRTPSV